MLERLAAEPAILRGVRESVNGATSADDRKAPSRLTVEEVVRAAQRGDGKSLEALEGVSQYLAMAVANVTALLNPEMIVMQSRVPGLIDYILPSVNSMVEHLVPHKPPIASSQLGNDAVLYGATLSVLRMLSDGVSISLDAP
jgi:predicted NBD/HSP70 family sugar kinase